MYVLVRAGLYPGLSVYCLLLTASPVLQSICSGVREILFCTSVLVEQSVCVHPLFVLYCIVYYKSVCVFVWVFRKGRLLFLTLLRSSVAFEGAWTFASPADLLLLTRMWGMWGSMWGSLGE